MTEKEANTLMTKIEDSFMTRFSKEVGFKYLAIKKNKKGKFYFELAYSKKNMKSKKASEIKDFIFMESVTDKNNIVLINYAHIKKGGNTQKVKEKVFESEFNFFSKKTTIQGGNFIRLERKGALIKEGTLGAIISLEKDNNLYLLSNYHVIMENKEKENYDICDTSDKIIAKPYWGLFNEKYDVAIAKLITSDCLKGTPTYCFGSIKSPSHKMKKIIGFGGNSGPDNKGTIYSTNAIVKVENKMFKNQILISGLDFTFGDSGTILVEDKGKHVVGLLIGGDNHIKIANNISNLFNETISVTNTNAEKIAKTKFKSFY